MTWTYGNDPGTSTAAQRRDAVRLALGDTETPPSAQINATSLTDEEIAYFLADSTDDVLGAALKGCDSLIGKWARKPSVSHGPSSVNTGSVLGSLQALRATLAHRVAIEAPWFAGGLTISGKSGLATDTAAIQPAFARGADSHPGTDSDSAIQVEEV